MLRWRMLRWLDWYFDGFVLVSWTRAGNVRLPLLYTDFVRQTCGKFTLSGIGNDDDYITFVFDVIRIF